MYQSDRSGLLQCCRCLPKNGNRFCERQRTAALNVREEIATWNVFLRNVVDRFEFTDVINLYDVRMNEGRDGACLLQEALFMVARTNKVCSHDLERDMAMQRFLKSKVNLRHATYAQAMQNGEASNALIG